MNERSASVIHPSAATPHPMKRSRAPRARDTARAHEVEERAEVADADEDEPW